MTDSAAERDIDRWFAHYSADHQDRGNQRIHAILELVGQIGHFERERAVTARHR